MCRRSDEPLVQSAVSRQGTASIVLRQANSKGGRSVKKERLAKVKKFVEENKKPLIIGGVLAVVGLVILGSNVTGESDPEPHTSRWLDSLSDDELREEHEKARLALRDAHSDWEQACKMDFWRRKIDSEIQRRKWGDDDTYVPSPSREHGKNLYRPD